MTPIYYKITTARGEKGKIDCGTGSGRDPEAWILEDVATFARMGANLIDVPDDQDWPLSVEVYNKLNDKLIAKTTVHRKLIFKCTAKIDELNIPKIEDDQAYADWFLELRRVTKLHEDLDLLPKLDVEHDRRYFDWELTPSATVMYKIENPRKGTE